MPDYNREIRLGRGAFGEVWLVTDRALGVKRAVKFIPTHKVKDPSNFYEEPQTLMTLKHENIVEITDAGKTLRDELYIAMEYYPNGSISDKMKGSIVPLDQSINLIADICRGLEYAHSLNFIHRDIKPANILIDNQDHGRLSDFGLATKVNIDGTASPYGYIGHLAPEVITHNITDKRTDIYALGITMYRLVNGDAYLPFSSDQDELLEMIKEGTFPKRNHYQPFIPSSIRNIINRALSLNPNDRFQSASELRHALEKIKIFTSWMPQIIPNGVIWTCNIGKMEYEAISIMKRRGCYDFNLLKGSVGNCKRIVHSETRKCLKKVQIESHTKNILCRFILKGK